MNKTPYALAKNGLTLHFYKGLIVIWVILFTADSILIEEEKYTVGVELKAGSVEERIKKDIEG